MAKARSGSYRELMAHEVFAPLGFVAGAGVPKGGMRLAMSDYGRSLQEQLRGQQSDSAFLTRATFVLRDQDRTLAISCNCYSGTAMAELEAFAGRLAAVSLRSK